MTQRFLEARRSPGMGLASTGWASQSRNRPGGVYFDNFVIVMNREKLLRLRRGVASGGLVGLAFLLALTLPCRRPSLPRDELLETSGGCRPTPGLLTGENLYRPWGTAQCGGKSRGSSIALERNVSVNWRGWVSLDPLDLALLNALSGKTSRAIAGLELAALEQERAVSALTDLSALYLLRYEAEGDPLDLLRSLKAAQGGLAKEPGQFPLRFNRAQALSMLGTRRMAEEAWLAVLTHGAAGGWREEATSHLRSLRIPSDEEQWRRTVPVLEAPAVTEAQIGTFVAQLPANARGYAEETLLPRWASAASRGEAREAARVLDLAATIGQELARQRGETLLVDAVSAIRRVMESGSSAQQRALFDGLQAFGAGVAEYHEQNLTSAREPLEKAVRELSAVECPLGLWARFYLAIDAYYEDADLGLEILDNLWADIPHDRYLALSGRIDWIAGTIDKVQARIQSSIRHYERAANALRRAGGAHAAAFVNVLLAEAYSLSGEHALGWQQRDLAFQTVRFSDGPRRNIAMWIEAKEALLRQGHLDLAGPFVEEAVAEADHWGRPLGRATAYPERASFRLAIGERDEALADLREAQEALSEIEDSALKKQLTVSSLITEGLHARTTDPDLSAELLEHALEHQSATGNRFEAITYTAAKAEAQLAAGRSADAAASLEEAIEIFEAVRATVEDPVSRMQAFRQAQSAFDNLMLLRTLEKTGSGAEALFRLAERSRARVLLELGTGRHTPDATQRGNFVRLAELAEILPNRAALVSYAVLNDRALAWVVDESGARLVSLNVGSREIAESIERFRLQMARGAEEEMLQQASAPLYDALLRPLGLASSAESLVIVPDRWLARLPFAALFDRLARRYLIEQRVVTIAPSATLLARGSRRISAQGGWEPSVLVVGVSSPGRFAARFLDRLPYARQEAQEVASLYPKATLLIGQEAVKGNFLHLSVSSDVIHFAGHAMVDLEAPRRSALLFPASSGEGLEPLSLEEIFGVSLRRTQLVVLSACRTQDSLADDREGLLGLAGAFFAAGVPEIVASPWNVEDRASSAVMVAFHREYEKNPSAGAAFRNTVLALMLSGTQDERSPAGWGTFTVISSLLDKEDAQWPSTSR